MNSLKDYGPEMSAPKEANGQTSKYGAIVEEDDDDLD